MILATTLFAGLLSLAAASPGPSPGETARSILADGYQTELPGGQGSVSPDRDLPILRPRSAGGARVLLYLSGAVLVVLLGLIVASFILEARGRRRQRRGIVAGAALPAPRPAPPEAAEPSPSWERLAARGRHAEAVHALLLAALAELARRSRAGVARSLTSREILRSARLPERAAGALRALVGAVEGSRFAGRILTGEDYARSLVSFEEWRAGLPGEKA